jgi:hypothetical protein
MLLVRLGGRYLQDLMDPLAADAKALADALKSPAFFPQPGDGGLLFALNPSFGMGVFEQELTPVVPATSRGTPSAGRPLSSPASAARRGPHERWSFVTWRQMSAGESRTAAGDISGQ